MGSLAHLFGFGSSAQTPQAELPKLFPLPIEQGAFVDVDVENIFTRILTAVLERTEGIPEDDQALLWDNCVASETSDGLVTLLAKAMSNKGDLFLVYDRALKLIRKADQKETQQIKNDYQSKGESSIGVYITFRNYKKADMVRLYSALEYFTIGGLWKQANLSKALQVKIADLRKSVGAMDAGAIEKQAVAIAEALKKGHDVMIDKDDILELLKIDISATQASVDFIAKKLSFYLGLPASWITGESKNSMGDTGEGDARAVERGLKTYFFAIIKPVCEALFDKKLTFKSEDFRAISSAMDTLRTFEATSDELISQDNKRGILNKMLGLPDDAKGDPPAQLPAPRTVNPEPAPA